MPPCTASLTKGGSRQSGVSRVRIGVHVTTILTRAGEQQLGIERDQWAWLSGADDQIMGTA